MAIDQSSEYIDGAITLVGTTNIGTWTRVTLHERARWAEIINDTGQAVQVQFGGTLQAEGDTYAATDRQVTCADGGSLMIPLSAGQAKSNNPAFNVRTAVATGTDLFRFMAGD